MESIRRQYENTTGPKQNMPPRRTGLVYPRLNFWKWFWLIFLVTLLIGFFSCKSTILPWMKDRSGAKAAVPATAADGDLATHQGAAAEGITAEKLKPYAMPTEAEMVQLFEYVRNSSHVKENLLYANTMKDCRFFYMADDDTVNAYAGLRKLNKGSDEISRVVCFLGGAARFARVAALAVAAEQCGDKGAGARFVNALTAKDCGRMDAAAALRVVNAAGLAGAVRDGRTLARAKSVSAGLMLGIMAHECGHQSLGHVLKTGDSVNLEISRNQEREADLFASSVIASSPFGEYILAGTLFWHYALAQQQEGSAATTHPLSKERFENFVRANAELAQSLGIALAK
jgi:hypothetical protein